MNQKFSERIRLSFSIVSSPVFAGVIVLFAAAVFAADVTSTWSAATSGVWNANANLTNAPVSGGFPNNGNAGVATYDATISPVGSPYTVTLSTNVTVEDLLLSSANATLSHTSGTFTATGAVTLSAGTYQLNGGTIGNTTVNMAGGTLAIAGNSNNLLTGVTINGDLTLNTGSARTKIAGGTTFNTVHLANSLATLGFAPSQTLASTILFDGAVAGTRLVEMNGAGTFTVGPTGVIRTETGLTGDGQIGPSFHYSGAMTLNNNGLISSQTSGRTITVNPATSFTNTGTLQAINGGNLIVPLGYTQTAGVTRLSGGGTISVSASPALNTITIGGGRLEATGTITANVANSATIAISPGLPAGSLPITGDLTLAPTSTLEIELGGVNQGTTFDFLSEAGTVPLNLAGALNITLLNGYVPAAADPLIILSSNQPLTGTFSNIVAGHILATDGLTSLRVSVIGNHVVISGLTGDYNHNGVVDATDYVVYRNTLGLSGSNLAADGNHNNQVDVGDYTIWQSNFGQTVGSGATVGLTSSAVPEPCVFAFTVIGILGLLRLRLRRRLSFPSPSGSKTRRDEEGLRGGA